MPELSGHIFLGYDPDTGNPTYYPALPSPTTAWYDLTDNLPGPAIFDPATKKTLPTVYVPDAEGDYNYLVPKSTTADISHQSIGLDQNLYGRADVKVSVAGYDALDGNTFLTAGEDQFRLVIALNKPLQRYDIIAFETVPALSEGDTVLTYLTSPAIFLGSINVFANTGWVA